MTIHSSTGWNTTAVALAIGRDGLDIATASLVVQRFGDCPVCGNCLSPDVGDAYVSDRDVLWENDSAYKSSAHTCEECGTDVRIFVEEKVIGIISEEQLPDNADDSGTMHYVPLEGSEGYLRINEFHIATSEATPRKQA